MKLIDLHKEWIRTGKLSNDGLCYCVPEEYRELFELFTPTKQELISHNAEGYWTAWWGKHKKDGYSCRIYNSFRQTIVLLICAMNNEL